MLKFWECKSFDTELLNAVIGIRLTNPRKCECDILDLIQRTYPELNKRELKKYNNKAYNVISKIDDILMAVIDNKITEEKAMAKIRKNFNFLKEPNCEAIYNYVSRNAWKYNA